MGGRTVEKQRSLDLSVVRQLYHDIIILEIGTNDLSYCKPEVVGSSIEELVRLILQRFLFALSASVMLYHAEKPTLTLHTFFDQARFLQRYLEVVFARFSNVFYN